MNNFAMSEQSGLSACLPTEMKHNISVLPLVTCRLNSPVANYRIRTDVLRVPCTLRKNKLAKHKAKNTGIHFS